MSNNAITEMFTDMIDEWIREKTQTINQMLTEKVTQSVMPGLTVAAIESIKTTLNYTTEQAMELLSVPQSERSLLDEMIRANEQTVTQRVTQKLTLAAIRNLKTKLNYTAELAMEVLSVPQSERGLYAKLAE